MNAPLPVSLAPAADAAAAAEPLVSLHGAAVHFGRTTALAGVDLTLRRGQRLALIGSNGSGKTTLLRLLHGLLPPSRGQRTLHRLAAEGRPPRMAMLFQRPFLMQLSVQRNLRLGLWLAGVPAAERAARSDEALHRVGLHDQAQRPAAALSGGQQQRLALARAWALRPDILFLDEPTASLDPAAKHEVESLVETLGRDGVTVVMSTHNLGQAKRLATHVAYLEAGRLVVQAPTDAFFGSTLPPAAAHFLRGENPWL
ncbi:MAG: ATP-binding cassette domain-containing protein [Rubrivivax sp.]|nr:ATP-binding cassette domain-containing protein [Rubrivivax sp.]